jgi:hypothetical protein
MSLRRLDSEKRVISQVFAPFRQLCEAALGFAGV